MDCEGCRRALTEVQVKRKGRFCGYACFQAQRAAASPWVDQTCTHCGATLPVPAIQDETITCQHCGTPFHLPEAKQAGTRIGDGGSVFHIHGGVVSGTRTVTFSAGGDIISGDKTVIVAGNVDEADRIKATMPEMARHSQGPDSSVAAATASSTRSTSTRPIRATPDSAPWRDTPIPLRLRLIGFVAILILFGLILWSALVLLAAVFGSILAAKVPLDASFIIWRLTIPTFGLVFGLKGWQSVRRYAFGHDDFRPKTSVPPRVLGHPIDIAMAKPISGVGTLQFTNSGIIIHAENATIIHIGPDLVADLILTAITYLLFNRRVKIDLSYEQIIEFKVVGRKVSVFALNGTARATQFKVSSHDGERLYRELNAHIPRAIEEWRHLLS